MGQTMSDEWAPTTDSVRAVYAQYNDDYLELIDPDHGAEFDRWLAKHDAEVRADQIEKDAKVVEAGGRYWDAELVHFRHLYPAEIAIELRWQKSAYMGEEN
jgi:hypothetical protein